MRLIIRFVNSSSKLVAWSMLLKTFLLRSKKLLVESSGSHLSWLMNALGRDVLSEERERSAQKVKIYCHSIFEGKTRRDIRTKHILAWAFFSFSRVYLFNIFLHISFHLPEGWLARSRIKNVNLGLSLIPPRHRESRRKSRRMLPLKATKSFYFELK